MHIVTLILLVMWTREDRTIKFWVVISGKRRYAKLRHRYYWKNITKDIGNYTRNCEKCKLDKVKPTNIEELTITETHQTAFDIVIIDTIGPLQRSISESAYSVIIMCDLTKYLVTIAIPNIEAKTIAKAIFENFILPTETNSN